MDINMTNPLGRELEAYLEKGNLVEAKMAQVIDRLTSKGKRYVSYGKLKQEMQLDDESFDNMMKKAKQSNRHSNKYIFTEVDDEPAVGITAAKRKKKRVSAGPNVPSSDPGYGIAHTGQKSSHNFFDKQTGTNEQVSSQKRIVEHRENELWSVLNRTGWRGLDRLDLLPEGWQGMTDTQIVDSIINEEFALNEAKALKVTAVGWDSHDRDWGYDEGDLSFEIIGDKVQLKSKSFAGYDGAKLDLDGVIKDLSGNPIKGAYLIQISKSQAAGLSYKEKEKALKFLSK